MSVIMIFLVLSYWFLKTYLWDVLWVGITIAVRQKLSNIDNDLPNFYICIPYQFTGFNSMTKRLRPDVIIYDSSYKRESKKKSKNSGSDYSYKVKFTILLI